MITSQAIRAELEAIWPDFLATSLLDVPQLAAAAGVKRVLLKMESDRPLGNFKSLGGTLAGLRALARHSGVADIAALLAASAKGRDVPRLLCASDGNHGLSVAAAAQRAGGTATIYLPAHIDAARASRIEAIGGEVRRVTGSYDDAVIEARTAASRGEGLLVPDTTEDIADPIVDDVMDGYSMIATELRDQFDAMGLSPTHAFVQAGVGGLAAAVAQGLADLSLHMAVVESASAPCVAWALEHRRPVQISENLKTEAQMLSCGLASAPALQILLKHDARSVLVNDASLVAARERLGELGINSTASGAAGLAGLMHVSIEDGLRSHHMLETTSIVLIIVTEGLRQPT